jgi:hypothetical protein
MSDVDQLLLKPADLSNLTYKLCHDAIVSRNFDNFSDNNAHLTMNLNKTVKGLKFRLQCSQVFHLSQLKIYSYGKLISLDDIRFSSSSLMGDNSHYDVSKLFVEKGIFHSKRETDPEIEIFFEEDTHVDKIEVVNFSYRYAYRAFSFCAFYMDPVRSVYLNFFDNWKQKKQCDSFINNYFSTKDFAEEKLISLFYVACSFGDEAKAIRLYDQINKVCDRTQMKAVVSIANELMALNGYGFNQHGFIRPFSLQTDEKIHSHFKQVVGLMTKLEEEFKIKSTIASGTLLGIHRDGKLIDHDDDIDMAYYSSCRSYEDIVKEQNSIILYLNSQGYNCKNTNHVQIQCELSSGVDLDLFPAWVEGENMTMSPLPINHIKTTDVFPLGTIKFQGFSLPVPKDINKMLVANYGPDYNKPDSNWRFDWPRANQEYRGFIEEQKAL